MESTVSTGGTVPPAELNTLLDRLLDEVEGNGTPPPSTASPPPIARTEPVGPGSPAVPSSAAVPPVPSLPTPSTGGGASLLGGLLANPALLTALPTLAENLGPLLGGLSGGAGTAPTATRPHVVDRHTALLCAVKPYLSPQRQNAAETVIRLCRVWDALDRSGISLSGLLSGMGGTVVASSTKTDGEVT